MVTCQFRMLVAFLPKGVTETIESMTQRRPCWRGGSCARSGNPWHPLSERSVPDVSLRSRDQSASRSESRGDYGVRILPRRIPENDLLDIRPAEKWRHKTKGGTVIPVIITSWELIYKGRPAELVLARRERSGKARGAKAPG